MTDLLSHMTPALSLNAPRLDVESLAHDCLERRVGIPGLLTIHLNSFVGWAIGTLAVAEFLVSWLGLLSLELVGCILMNSQHRGIAYEEPFVGTVDGAEVHMREAVRFALRRNAALALENVRDVDHLLVAGDSVVSLAQQGLTCPSACIRWL